MGVEKEKKNVGISGAASGHRLMEADGGMITHNVTLGVSSQLIISFVISSESNYQDGEKGPDSPRG